MKSARVFLLFMITVFVISLSACQPSGQGLPKDGKDGKSAYELALDNGFQGSVDDWLLSLVGKSGKDGFDGIGIKEIGMLSSNGNTDTYSIVFTDNSTQTFDIVNGIDGQDGVGITKIEKTSSIGPIDNYTVTFTNLKTETFSVTNGIDGKDGLGIKSVDKTSSKENVDTYTITFSDNSNTTFAVTNGTNGSDGNGIEYIQKTSTEENIDTYTVSFTDGTSTTFKITNGFDGEKGDKGDKGDKGENGASAYDIYCSIYGYDGTVQEWITEYVGGNLLKHTVTFDLNGGAGNDDFSNCVIATHNKTINLSTPSREGFTFMGWYTGTSVNDGKFTTTDTVTDDMNLVAIWQINKLEVSFKDFEGNTVDTQIVDYGTAASAPTLPSIVGNYIFHSWDKDFSEVTENSVVTAVYIPNVYKITYNTNEGSEISEQTVYVNYLPTLPQAPTKTGYYFTGWYLDESYSIKYEFDYALNEDSTLYAEFSEYISLATYEDLLLISSKNSAKYCLVNDINCNGESLVPIDNFYGVIEGYGHKIYNFVLNDTENNTGFVRTNYGDMRNIVLEDFSFHHNVRKYMSSNTTLNSGVIASVNNGTIENCVLRNATVAFDIFLEFGGQKTLYVNTGGICGTNNGTVSNCINEAEISFSISGYINVDSWEHSKMYSNCGGIVGLNKSVIENSTVNTDVSVVTDGDRKGGSSSMALWNYVGGLIGKNELTVSGCRMNGNISSAREKTYMIDDICLSALVANNAGVVENSYAKGSIEAYDFATCVGGAVSINNGTVKTSYADVDIVSEAAGLTECGGFVASNAGTVYKCFSMGNINAMSCKNYGYLIGHSTGSESKSYYADIGIITIAGTATTPTNQIGLAIALDELLTVEFLVNTLLWSEDVWVITDGEAPVLNKRYI